MPNYICNLIRYGLSSEIELDSDYGYMYAKYKNNSEMLVITSSHHIPRKELLEC